MTVAEATPLLRRSRFAVRSELDGDGVLWTSTRTGAHLLLDRHHDRLLEELTLDPDQLPAGLAEVLVASGVAVPADADEHAAAIHLDDCRLRRNVEKRDLDVRRTIRRRR